MVRWSFWKTLHLGLLASGILAASACADETAALPPAPAAAAAEPDCEGAAVPAAEVPQDPRDRKIEELNRVIDDLRRRVEELEKRPAPPSAPEPASAPPPAPVPPPGGRPGATLLPNISLLGDIRFRAGDTRNIPSRGRATTDEIEIAFQDAVAPRFRYDIFLAAEKEEEFSTVLEEGYLTATALSQGLSARLGRILVPFGKLNALHEEQFVFVTRPAVHAAFLGPEGLRSDGFVVQYLLPMRGLFANLELGRWETTGIEGGEAAEAVQEGDPELIPGEEDLGFKGGEQGAYSARLRFGKELGRDKELELGLSRYWGRGPVSGIDERKRLAVSGFDLTYRSFPAAYKRFLLQAEYLIHETRDIDGETKRRDGAYLLAHYRWSRYWDAGIRGDYTEFPFPFSGRERAINLFVTRHLTEQTLLRLQYTYGKTPGFGDSNAVFFQILFGSGPHAHVLQ